MKTTVSRQPQGLLLMACVIGAQWICLWPANQVMAMSIRRAPFHKSDVELTALQSPSWRTLAGFPAAAGTNDGPGISARFLRPTGLAVGADGSIYVADYGAYVIRKVDRDGIVSTVAGQPGQQGRWDGPGWDGPANNARFRGPSELAIDAGNNLYVAGRRVRAR